MPQTEATRCRQITALLIPADDARPARVVEVEDRARAYSELIGGGLLDETPIRLPDGEQATVYLDENRIRSDLARNRRACCLAERLRWPPAGIAGLRGDLLVTGLGSGWTDIDVPHTVLSAARTCGFLDTR
jgi:hypothetical protein